MKHHLLDTNVILADVLDFHVHHAIAKKRSKTMDGYLSGLAIENSLVLVNIDKGFKKMKKEGLDFEWLL